MRKFTLACSILLHTIISYAQTPVLNNTPMGYQEFPVVINGQTSDALGNMYYTGTFKGPLTINNQILTSGQGLDDIFWVKTAPNGQVIKYRTYGSPNQEIGSSDGLVSGANNQQYFYCRILENVTFGTFTAAPYIAPLGVPAASVVSRIDTAGNIRWIKRTNLVVTKILADGAMVHVVGLINPGSGDIKVEDTKVLDSVGKPGIVHLMFDTLGNFLNKKVLSMNLPTDQVQLQQLSVFRDHHLFFSLRLSGMTMFNFNGTPSPLPAAAASYHVFIRTDTSYTGFRSRVINPLRTSIYGSGALVLPCHLSGTDSIYTVMHAEVGQPYNLDGFTAFSNQNTLMVWDSTLVIRRSYMLGPAFVFPYPQASARRKVYYRSITSIADTLYFTGMYMGINESPNNLIPVKDTLWPVINEQNLTIDYNGPSRSWIAKTSLGFSHTLVRWLGYHTEYETSNIAPVFIRSVNSNKIFFVTNIDNTWNPWIINSNTLIPESGVMKKGNDGAETSQLIEYFSDGSRLILGYARGKTIFDLNSTTIKSNPLRRDLFLTRLDVAGNVVWFKRFHSTLLSPEARKLVIKGNKAFFLVNYLQSVNDSNFVTIGTDVFDVKPSASVLASVDINGVIDPISLRNPVTQYAHIRDFSFFSNGDLAATASNQGQVPYLNFPVQGNCFYLLRYNGTNGALSAARKFWGTVAPQMYSLEIDNADKIYLSGSASFHSTIPQTKLFMHNGIGTIDSIVMNNITAPFPQQTTVLKFDMNMFDWTKRTDGGAGASARPIGGLYLVNNKPMIPVMSQQNGQPMNWESTLIHNGANGGRPTLIQLDGNGNMVRSKIIPAMSILGMRKGSQEQLYITGYAYSGGVFDTIVVANAGFSDGLAFIYDSTFKAKRHFRLATPYNEAVYDMAIHADTLAAFAFTAQTVPGVFYNRSNVVTGDYDEDAYAGTVAFRPAVITGVGNPPPPGNGIMVTPNPVVGRQLILTAKATSQLPSTIIVFNASGQVIHKQMLTLQNGKTIHAVDLPESLQQGVYYIRLSNAKWQEAKAFLVK